MPKKDDKSRESEEQVLTPGGMRPRSAVRHVKPGEVVEGTGTSSQIEDEPATMRPGTAMQETGRQESAGAGLSGGAGDEPAGMRPESSEPSQAALSATGAGGAGGAGDEPPGMRPASMALDVRAAPEQADVAAADLVLTPGGYRDRSLVHHIEPDHFLDLT